MVILVPGVISNFTISFRGMSNIFVWAVDYGGDNESNLV